MATGSMATFHILGLETGACVDRSNETASFNSKPNAATEELAARFVDS